MLWPAVGVVGGGEAYAAAETAMRGRSRRHDRRWFGRLEQEDQRLKKHYVHWMAPQRSLFIQRGSIDRLQLAAVAKESLDRVYLTAIDRSFGFNNA